MFTQIHKNHRTASMASLFYDVPPAVYHIERHEKVSFKLKEGALVSSCQVKRATCRSSYTTCSSWAASRIPPVANRDSCGPEPTMNKQWSWWIVLVFDQSRVSTCIEEPRGDGMWFSLHHTWLYSIGMSFTQTLLFPGIKCWANFSWTQVWHVRHSLGPGSSIFFTTSRWKRRQRNCIPAFSGNLAFSIALPQMQCMIMQA